MISEAECRRVFPLFLPQERAVRLRPPLRRGVPRSRGIDLTSDYPNPGYRYEDAVLDWAIANFGGFWVGPHALDWIFTPRDAREELKKKGNSDGWMFDISDPNSWSLEVMLESNYRLGDIEKRSSEKYNRFRHVQDLEKKGNLPLRLREAFPEINTPSRIIVPPYERILKVYVSPDPQTAVFFVRPDVKHFPLPRNVVQKLAA